MNLWSDLSVMLSDFGVPVAAGGKQTKGLLDSADEMLLQNGAPAGIIGTQRVLTIATGSINVAPGTQLDLGGEQFIAREVYRLDDGLLTRVMLASAA